MSYREKPNGSIEIATPMGTLILSGQKAYSDTLKETEGNWGEVLKALSHERKDKRRIMESIRKNLLHVKNEKDVVALQHLKKISKAEDKLKDLNLRFIAWRQEQHCKDMTRNDALKEAKAELNASVIQESMLKQAL